MGNSLPTEEMAPAQPTEEMAPALPSEEIAPALPSEEIAPALPSEEIAPVSEQGGGTSEVPIMQGPVILPETGGVSLEAGPVEEDPSESGSSILGTSPSYAAHVEGPEAALSPPPQEPSPGVDRFDPSPVAAAVAEARPEVVTVPDQAEDDWGPWRAQNVASSEAQAPVAASSEAQDVRDVKRPRRGIPAGSRARVGAVPTPNESEEDLLKQVFFERTRGPSPGGRGFGPAPSGGGRRTVASSIPFLRTPEPIADVRFTCFVLDGQKLPHPSGPGWWWQFARPRGWSHGCQWQRSAPPTRGIWRGNTLCSSETSSVSRAGAAASATAEAAYRPGHDYGQCLGGVACLVKAGPAGQKLERMGIDFFRRCYCRGISRRSPAAGGACERRSLDQRPSGRRQEEAEASAGVPDLGRYPALSQESLEMHRLLRWFPQWVPRIVAGTIVGHWAGEARWVHCLGRTGGMEIPGGFGRTSSPEIIGQKESEEPHCGCYDGYLVAEPESCSREAAASAAADADHACRGKLGLLFGGCVRSFGRVTARRGRSCRVDRYPPLPWDRNAVAARGHYPGVWNTGFAGSAVSRGWCCSSFGRKECRRRLLFEPRGRYSCGHTGDGTAHAGGNTGYMAPPTPAATEPKSPASLASVIHRPGMLVAKTLLASDGSTVPLPPGVPPRHVLPQPPPPPSKSPSARPPQDPLVPSKGQTQQEREFTLPSPVGVASSAPLGATASETGTQFADYEAVVEAAKAAMERASRDL